jgi:hypothetical protein
MSAQYRYLVNFLADTINYHYEPMSDESRPTPSYLQVTFLSEAATEIEAIEESKKAIIEQIRAAYDECENTTNFMKRLELALDNYDSFETGRADDRLESTCEFINSIGIDCELFRVVKLKKTHTNVFVNTCIW